MFRLLYKKSLAFFTFFIIFHCSSLSAQSISPEILNKKWNAYWISSQQNSNDDYQVYHFRKKVQLTEPGSSFIIHVSADSRYKLFVNGKLVSLGPARSDLYHWNFETLDIASHLKSGENTIHAIVWNFGSKNPEAQISYRTAFILQGNSTREEVLNTNKSWTSFLDQRYSPLIPDLVYTYYVAGPGERIDYGLTPDPLSINMNWVGCREISNGLPKGVFEWTDGWMLVPRSIPPMELKPERFALLKSNTGNQEIPQGFPAEKKNLTIAPNKKVTLLLDQGKLTNAYPVIRFSKGKAAKIQLGYAEGLYVDEGSAKPWKAQNQKGNRNEVNGKRFVGVKDEIISSGAVQQEFTTLVWRTWRYLQVEIETAAEALVIEDLYGNFTGYPFEQKAKIDFGDPRAQQIFDVGWRTARLCAVETYMDCPYYEQLQYIGDARIQALVSLYNSGDDRLVRQAISQLDNSRLAEGVTLSRFPTAHAQEIPPFTLWWIGMLHDFYMYRGDTAWLKKFLPGMRQVISFFSGYQEQDGSLKNTPYWNFTDWCESKGWERGVGPKGSNGYSAMLDMQLLWAYQHAYTLENAIGNDGMAAQYGNSIRLLENTIRKKYWDEGKKLFADTEDKNLYSQHTNTLAILTGLVKDSDAEQMAGKILSDTSLAKATIYFNYYVHLALAKAGKGNDYMKWLTVWRENLKQGMTTWAEISDINKTRSDCHAWGASPNIEFFRIVLGIETGAPGFSKVRINPNPGEYKTLKGSIPHPAGDLSVDYEVNGKNIRAKITLPPGITGVFVWNQKDYLLKEGENLITAN